MSDEHPKAELAIDVIELDAVAANIDSMATHLRRRDWRGRWLFRMVIVAFVAGACVQTWQAVTLANGQAEIKRTGNERTVLLLQTQRSLQNTDRSLQILVDATSPEAKATASKATAVAIQQIVNQSNCNERLLAIQFIDGFERRGLLQPGDVIVAACPGPPTGH